MRRHRIWVVDDDQSIRWVLERAFQKADIYVDSFASADEALDALNHSARLPDAVISDVRMTGTSGLEFLETLQREQNNTPVIIMTAHADLQTAVSAYEGGAFEYLPKPFDVDEVVEISRRAFESAGNKPKTVERPAPGTDDLIGETPAMQDVFRTIGRLSRSNTTVLINGESGTGKELIANALHRHSPRVDEPFIALNMAAIPHDLLESELFGHEKGAFTGATERRRGRFEQASGGTLFLDEIGDMPPEMQTRLLRVLSENQFYRVGGHQAISVDVRIIAATHQNLEQLVEQHRFRADLYHRLNVIRISAPPLRDRIEDIPLLLKAFLRKSADELGVDAKQSTEELDQTLMQLPWPGNVRQLENLARWLTVMASGRELAVQDLPDDLVQSGEMVSDKTWVDEMKKWASAGGDVGKLASEQLEQGLIASALQHTGNRKHEAATALGWGRNTLTRKLKEYGLE
jgi:two-component system nitrogen regulation response regulator GlnG